MKPTPRQLRHISRLLLWIMIAFSVPASLCHASVEPELTTAIRHRDFPRIQTLLSEGVNVNERDEYEEQTPLMWAVKGGDVAIVQTLLQHNAEINARDDNGNTALMFAIKNGYAKIAKLLVDKGAKGKISDSVSPLSTAVTHERGRMTRVQSHHRRAAPSIQKLSRSRVRRPVHDYAFTSR